MQINRHIRFLISLKKKYLHALFRFQSRNLSRNANQSICSHQREDQITLSKDGLCPPVFVCIAPALDRR